MTGLAYAGYYRPPENWPLRWAAVVALVALVHLLPMFYLKMGGIPLADVENVIAVDFTDLPTETETPKKIEPSAATPKVSPPEKGPGKATDSIPEPPKTLLRNPEPRTLNPEPLAVPAAPAPKKELKVELPKVEQPKAAPLPLEEKKLNLREPDMPALSKKDIAAFDESKVTKEIPKDGYASDRNSTAADRGPKNLPRGDPYLDKGESNLIRYMERRGEGNLPALSSDPGAGSVKKEGDPQAGRGALHDERPPDKKMPPKSPIRPDEVDTKVRPSEKTATSPVLDQNRDRVAQAVQPAGEIQANTEHKGAAEGEGEKRRKGEEEKTELNVVQSAIRNPQSAIKTPTPKKQPIPEDTLVAEKDSPRRNTKADELAAFEAQLEGKGKQEARGGKLGDRVGIMGRAGAKGHEGDGTLRPGHDEAVSDVTTVNLESSAEEFDDARFAKKFDAKTAYVKPLARRIDAKWKANNAARLRYRLVHGPVTMRIVIRSDGKLLEASEVKESRVEGMPDELVATAKSAIQAAADPTSEPFPAELSNHETLEFVFNFLY
ncbi:MAG TPA: hypothetical protein VGP72_16040 [Planctomycetota bacterium]|jgi:hypothetical protein